MKPNKMNGPIVFSYKLRPEQRIYDEISNITISMKATDHLQMPELISSGYEVQMDEQGKQKYEMMKEQLVLSLPEGEVTAANENMENPEERLLLKYGYLKNEGWEEISYELNVSYRTVQLLME